jgi:DNA-binding response OmpR family regulator
MHNTLSGKKVLIVKGSLLVPFALEMALSERGARPTTATNIISAFSLIERERFDAVVIDKGLHNEAFDICAELKSFDIPYVLANAPHELQKPAAQMSAACEMLAELSERLVTRERSCTQSDLGVAARYPAVKGMASMGVIDPTRF